QATRDGRASRKILLNERADHVALEALLVINHVIRDADGLSHPARVVDIIQRAAASLHRLGHAFAPSQPALVPQLHGQADNLVSLSAQHGRNRGRVDSSRHGDCDGSSFRIHDSGVSTWHLAIGTWSLSERAKYQVLIANY